MFVVDKTTEHYTTTGTSNTDKRRVDPSGVHNETET